MSKQAKKRISWGLILIGLGLIVLLDIAKSPEKHNESRYTIVDAVSAATRPGQSVVGVIRSDFEQLKEAVSPDSALTEAQVEHMVRYAISMAGGLHTIIEPGTDWVVIKPNIVELKPRGSGVITDCRVVKALVKIVHGIVPEARITIAEGSGEWIPPDRADIKATVPRAKMGDGFEVAGYRALLSDEALSGVPLDIVDLNFDEAVEVTVPDEWYAREKYFIPSTILECDVLISVPVLKIHDGVGMTNAMKNFVGIAPGMIYGWAKMLGYPPGSGNPGLPHTPEILDETIVDLSSLSDVDFTVVDAIVAMERFKSDEYGGKAVRMNTIIASADIVAADAVSARLMGLNPDDIEYLTLAAYKGLGQCDLETIKVNGNPIEQVARRFEKCPADWGKWGEQGHYGQGARTWLLKGPFEIGEMEAMTLDPKALKPVPDQDGWSKPVYFHDDRIDLDTYYNDPVNCVIYAYTEFTAPKSQTAELWVGSGEDLKVWINGAEVYAYKGVRRHRLPNDREGIQIEEGRNMLLVQAKQTRGGFDFSVNICEPEPDKRYDGNRVFGLKFVLPETQVETASVSVEEVVGFRINEWLNLTDEADRFEQGAWTIYTTENGLSGNRVRSMAFGPDGSLWVVAEGLCRFDGKRWTTYAKNERFPKGRIRDVAVDREGSVWLASNRGLYSFDGKSTASHLGGWIPCVTVDHQGRVWSAAWGQGASVYDGKTWKTYTEHDGLSHINVFDITADLQGNLWMATMGGGVNRFDGKTWMHYTTDDGLRDNHVNSIVADQAGNIWIAMDDNGVSRFDGKTWTNYGKKDGLAGRDVRALMVTREGFAWVATENNGLSRFDGQRWVTGICNEEVLSIVQGPDGRIWFGSGGGGVAVLGE
ncbi:MAG: DUF362 domain-containing protein [Candidatus Latescibacteria bacterium]|nr:DUF362 domain-containing protein [Candidatus Latescibacterota bacterium]